MTRKFSLVVLMGVILLSSGVASLAQEASTTLQGEVIDPALYLREGRHGLEVEDLIYDAVDGGQTLALLEDGTETLYLFLAKEPGEDPSELLYDYVGQRVKVTGSVYERGGLKGIVVTAAEPLETPAAPASEEEVPPE